METQAAAQSVLIPHLTAEALVGATFARLGCEGAEAARVAQRLVGANLRGHDSHGIIRTERYVEWVKDGLMYPNVGIKVETENDVMAVVDGQYGFGQTLGEQTVDLGVAKAKTYGVAVTALKNAGHLGRIGDWAERAAAAGLASIHMVNVRGSLLVAPFGGVDRRMGTSPFAAGIPQLDAEPIIVDFATSVVAEGKAYVALKGGPSLPEGALVAADGTLTSDPWPLYGELAEGRVPDPNLGPGALCAFGSHKGSALNFLMEMMGGALTGSGTAGALGETERRRFCNGMLSIFLSVDRFHPMDEFTTEVQSYIEFVKSSRAVDEGVKVLVPGEKERRLAAERSERGLPMSAEAWESVVNAGRSAGLNEDEIQSLRGTA